MTFCMGEVWRGGLFGLVLLGWFGVFLLRLGFFWRGGGGREESCEKIALIMMEPKSVCENYGLLLVEIMCIHCIKDYAANMYLTINIRKICF